MITLWNDILAGTVATTMAILLAYGAARMRFSVPRGVRITMDALFLLPLALPSPLVIKFAIRCPDFTVEDIISALPVFYLCGLMGFRRVHYECIDAARLQGLGSCGIFWRIWFPAAWPWLAAGLILGWFRNALLWAILHA